MMRHEEDRDGILVQPSFQVGDDAVLQFVIQR